MSAGHTDEMVGRAALAALGALEGAEAAEFEAHLYAGCEICAEELRSFREVSGPLGELAAAARPHTGLRDAVLARIAAETALDETPRVESDGILFARPPAFAWQDSGIAGIDVKLLHRDDARQMRTQMIRLAAGAAIPAHRHKDVEEIYLIDGELIVNDVLMRAGDYCRAPADSVHRRTLSPRGCVFIVISSERDEPLETL